MVGPILLKMLFRLNGKRVEDFRRENMHSPPRLTFSPRRVSSKESAAYSRIRYKCSCPDSQP